MPLVYPNVNGVAHEFASVEIKLGGQLYYGVTAINYKSPLKPTKQRGNHPSPLGRTSGIEEPDGDLEMFLAEAMAFIKVLGPGYKLKVFDVLVNYQAAGMDLVTDSLLGCRIIDVEANNAAGPDPLKRKLPLDVMKVLINGLEALPNPLKGNG